jgi:hypothetical protein
MNCTNCSSPIPEGRLKAIPSTRTCTPCSTTSRVAGFAIISGKNTYSEIQLVSQETAKHLSKVQERKGLVSTGMKQRVK